jgi:hypothetical protein
VVEIVAVLLFIASVADEKTKRYVTGSLCDFGYMASRASGFHLRYELFYASSELGYSLKQLQKLPCFLFVWSWNQAICRWRCLVTWIKMSWTKGCHVVSL